MVLTVGVGDLQGGIVEPLLDAPVIVVVPARINSEQKAGAILLHVAALQGGALQPSRHKSERHGRSRKLVPISGWPIVRARRLGGVRRPDPGDHPFRQEPPKAGRLLFIANDHGWAEQLGGRIARSKGRAQAWFGRRENRRPRRRGQWFYGRIAAGPGREIDQGLRRRNSGCNSRTDRCSPAVGVCAAARAPAIEQASTRSRLQTFETFAHSGSIANYPERTGQSPWGGGLCRDFAPGVNPCRAIASCRQSPGRAALSRRRLPGSARSLPAG